ncbi:AEC family transporter [Mesorhizobium sp. ZMM04-5]|uniref:AEC family transporter n=1 Tax=Mesorhizobium marinum TaxID=3228790 RepID=A0ABV3QVW9_9HYPH
MSPVIETVLFVFGLVALGYLAGATGFLKAEVGDALSQFAVGVALPLLLFRTMVGADFHGSAPWSLWAAYFSAVVVAWTAGHLTTTRIFGRDSRAGVVGGVATAFSNLLLLGVPFMQGVFGREGFEILSLIIAVHLPVMMMASIILFSIFGPAGGAKDPLEVVRRFASGIARNPLVIGILIGLAWRMTGLPLPSLAARLVDALAGIAGPLALFAMGLGLRKFGISANVAPALALSALKLFLMPAVALAAVLLLGLPPLAAKVVVAAASLPSGVNSYLIATQFGTGQALASNQMTISTACAVATTAFWLTAAQAVLG